MPDNETVLSSEQGRPDGRIRNIILSTESGMSVYTLLGFDEVINNPDDFTTISRLNEIRQSTHEDVDDQTEDIGQLFDELKETTQNWDIYGKSELDEGLLDDYKWLDWKKVASALVAVETGHTGDEETQGSVASTKIAPGVDTTADTAEMPQVVNENPEQSIEVAEESVAFPPLDLADLAVSKVALESVQSKSRKEGTEFPVSPTYPGEDVYMADASADDASVDEDMMDVVSSEDRQGECKDTIMSD